MSQFEIRCVLCMLLCLVQVSLGMFHTFKMFGNVLNCVRSQHRIQPAIASSSIWARQAGREDTLSSIWIASKSSQLEGEAPSAWLSSERDLLGVLLADSPSTLSTSSSSFHSSAAASIMMLFSGVTATTDSNCFSVHSHSARFLR